MSDKRHPIIALHHFSYASSECQKLFNDGYYFGCITLCQSLAEAYARFLCQRGAQKSPSKVFTTNINNCRKEQVKPDVTPILTELYGGQQRYDFHHLNTDVPTEYMHLKDIANTKIRLLNDVESKIFEYRIDGGKLTMRYPTYWDTNDGLTQVYLRLEP